MNIMVVGSGGREHALCWKIAQSAILGKLYCMPGNAGTSGIAENISMDVADHNAVTGFCLEKNITLVVVGPELPLAEGLADSLRAKGVSVFGPSRAASRLESSKTYAKELMARKGVPTAGFRAFDGYDACVSYLQSAVYPIVVKADGLAAGKGVFVCTDPEEAFSVAERLFLEKELGQAGEQVLVEDFLEGEEVSMLFLVDGQRVVPLASSQDHKRVGEGDTGANTGGMGAYSPAPDLGGLSSGEVIMAVVEPVLEGLREDGVDYRGVLYAGLMVTDNDMNVLEFNVRLGDPETQVVLPRMKNDIVPYLAGSAEGSLPDEPIEWDSRQAVCVVLAAGGYPGKYEKGVVINGIDRAEELGALVFHAGTAFAGEDIVTAGGRVLGVVALGEGIKGARDKAYNAAGKISFDKAYYRRDIAHRAVARCEKAF